MQCTRCERKTLPGEETIFNGQRLCEDCYIDALSPAKPCDPWAVFSARSLSGKDTILTKRQKNILTQLETSSGMEIDTLAGVLGMAVNELEREVATLRHMEKIRVVKQGDMKQLKGC